VAIIGDRRKYLSALVVPAFPELEKWAKKNSGPFASRNDLIKNREVNKLIETEILNHTKEYARVEQVRMFRLLNAEWTQDSGELTPSQKVKRRVVEQKYAAEIESMYPAEAD
jgi:long-chain acyl-CoA synthetase